MQIWMHKRCNNDEGNKELAGELPYHYTRILILWYFILIGEYVQSKQKNQKTTSLH